LPVVRAAHASAGLMLPPKSRRGALIWSDG
jgi:hypothetical protein